MKLQQLQFLEEIVRRGLSISQAAEAMHTSQSGVSRQIALLEQELNLQIFERHGKRLVSLTPAGELIVAQAGKVLQELKNLKRVGDEFSQQDSGRLSIATTHTQARYFLPEVVKAFSEAWPQVQLSIHQGSPTQVAEQVVNGTADVGIATEVIGATPGLISLACYEWNRCVVAPRRHPLLRAKSVSLADLAQHPLITYDFAFAGGSMVLQAFEAAGLQPNIVLTAIDADVIKTYVKLGLGIGLVATMAYDEKRDTGLASLDVSHLFRANTTYLGLRGDVFLRKYLLDFIRRLVSEQAFRQLTSQHLRGQGRNRTPSS